MDRGKFKYFIAVMSLLAVMFFCLNMLTGCASTGPTDTGTTIVDLEKYPDLQEGDSGQYVTELQKLLGMNPDGKFGPVTKQRVIQFQNSKGLVLKYPGTVGQKTWALLLGATPPVTSQPDPVTSEPVVIPDVGSVPTLAWDDVAARKEWSKLVFGLVSKDLWPKFKQMTDGSGLCSKYNNLNDYQKQEAISEMIVAIVFRESGYKPTSRMYETTMGYYSEGLLQLSYVDKEWAPFCKFDKKNDDKLYPSPTDPRRTILDPFINLDCGIRILANQIDSKKKILLDRGVYWAVIKIGGKYTKIAEIKAQVEKNAGFCK